MPRRPHLIDIPKRPEPRDEWADYHARYGQPNELHPVYREPDEVVAEWRPGEKTPRRPGRRR